MSERSQRRESYSARLFHRTLASWGARVGLAWIFLLLIVAVFAPILANSFPLLVSFEGKWHSPAIRYFSAVDFAWLAGFFSFFLFYLLTRRGTSALLLTTGVSLVVVSLVPYLHVPPKLSVYEEFRASAAKEKMDWAVYAPIPYSPRDYLRDQGDTGLQAPSWDHWLGTEENGADVLSRMIHASRIALGIGFVATGIAMVIGIIIGGLMGFFSGLADIIGMRLVEIFEAIPTLFLLLAFVAFFGRSLYIMMVIIGLTSWPGFARYIRAEFLKLRTHDYIQAAIACGLPLRSILFRHMLPNGMAPVLVAASFGVASAILAEATLSFLGLGLVDSPSWGQMLNQAVRSSAFNWWMAVFPGGAIFFTVFAYNLIGDALRDAIDPHLSTSV
ncbi:MAG: ABC transporter permease [bacterium]